MRSLLDEAFLRRLSRLRFLSKSQRGGRLTGHHVSPRAGMSIEFADYREYRPGDDLRYVDWNLYGRLEKLFVKTFAHESDLPVYLLMDASASMQLGGTPKAVYAAQLALSLAYLGLRSMERVGLYPFAERVLSNLPPRHGMQQLGRIYRALSDLEQHQDTLLDKVLSEFTSATKESGLVIVLSDLLCSLHMKEGLSRLLYRGDDIVFLQVLAPGEMEPQGGGLSRIVDVETGRHVTLNLGRSTLDEYKVRFDQHQSELRSLLHELGVPLFTLPTTRPLERVLFEDLREGGILR